MIRILIVDDEKLERKALQIILERHYGSRIQVAEAGSVQEAVERAIELKPHLAFMDIRMPGGDGLQGARLLKARFPKIHIVMLTAHAEFEYAHMAIKFHVDDYLLKPVRAERVIETVDRIFEDSARSGDAHERLMESLNNALMGGNYQQSRSLFQQSVSGLDNSLEACKQWAAQVLTLLEKTRMVYHVAGTEDFQGVMASVEAERIYSRVIDHVQGYMERIFEEIITGKLARLGGELDYAVEYIEKNLHRDITLGEIAQFMNISPHYFSRIFKKVHSQNFVDFVTDRKIIQAIYWLRSTDKSINEVALALGFSEPNYFSKVFKKRLGTTPSEFKRLRKDEAQKLVADNLEGYHHVFFL